MPFCCRSWSRATTPCASGSCAPIVIAAAGIAAKPKLRSIGCAVPSPAYGRSIRPTSPDWHNDDSPASTSCQPKTRLTGSSALPMMKGDRLPSQNCLLSLSSSQGRLSHFLKEKRQKAILGSSHRDGRGRSEGQSPSFFLYFPFSADPLPLPQTHPSKFGMTH